MIWVVMEKLSGQIVQGHQINRKNAEHIFYEKKLKEILVLTFINCCLRGHFVWCWWWGDYLMYSWKSIIPSSYNIGKSAYIHSRWQSDALYKVLHWWVSLRQVLHLELNYRRRWRGLGNIARSKVTLKTLQHESFNSNAIWKINISLTCSPKL